MQRMKPPSLITLEVLLSGRGAAVPFDMKSVTGILVWQDVGNLATWDGAEWIPLNSSGFASRFGTNVPVMQVGTWAIISSPRLAVTGGQCFRKFKPSELLFAFHAISVEEFQPAPESCGNAVDLDGGNPGRDEINGEVNAFIAELTNGGSIPPQS